MEENVWFLSAVINSRFSVTTITAVNEKDATNQALEHLRNEIGITDTLLITVVDPIKDQQGNDIDSFTITSECFVASLIRA